ncbi:MAG TPA: universal stress protein [Acidobacteriota bacterium]
MKLNSIVVATDFSEASLIAVETAFSLTFETDATLYLVHVVEQPVGIDPVIGVFGPSPEELFLEDRKQLDALIPYNMRRRLNIEKVALTGAPAKVIADFAREKEADLIVVGTHGRKGLDRIFMGSTAENLLRHAPCQVLVVKQKAPRKAAAAKAAQKKAS